MRELIWSKNAEHTNFMPLVSADGRCWSPLCILPDIKSKFLFRPDGTRETPSSFLPPKFLLVYRDPTGMDAAIFFQWVNSFFEEIRHLRSEFKYNFVTLGVFSGHISYFSLQLFRDKNIIVLALPTHKIHRTQYMNYTVFLPSRTASERH